MLKPEIVLLLELELEEVLLKVSQVLAIVFGASTSAPINSTLITPLTKNILLPVMIILWHSQETFTPFQVIRIMITNSIDFNFI